MSTSLKNLITNNKIKGAVAIVAAIVMWFTPDHIDMIIETCLVAFGINQLIIKEKELESVFMDLETSNKNHEMSNDCDIFSGFC